MTQPGTAPAPDQQQLLEQLAALPPGQLAALLQAVAVPPADAAPPAPAGPAGADAGPPAAGPAAPAPAPGSLARYTSWDSYAVPARDRDQLILVTALEDDGDGGTRVRGFPLGYAEQAASFLPAQLAPPE